MLGAIVGDIVGSRFEFNNHCSKDFDLFAEGCFAKDDSIMTLAVAKSIMEAEKQVSGRLRIATMRIRLANCLAIVQFAICRKSGGIIRTAEGRFYDWMFSENPKPYNSFGNGACDEGKPCWVCCP